MGQLKNLLSIVFVENTDLALQLIKETCAERADGFELVDLATITLDSYPQEHTDTAGRMFDYGDEKSDSHEGRMTKAKLARLASMSQSLHDRLEDGDDLPEWIQDKITTSEDRISSAYDYIDYKLSRILDLESIELHEERLIQEGVFQDAVGWIKSKGSAVSRSAKTFFISLKTELMESAEGLRILGDIAMMKKIPPKDVEFLKIQTKDIVMGSALLGLFILPFGGLAGTALVKTAKRFGVNLMPTAFSETR